MSSYAEVSIAINRSNLEETLGGRTVLRSGAFIFLVTRHMAKQNVDKRERGAIPVMVFPGFIMDERICVPRANESYTSRMYLGARARPELGGP